MEKEKIQTLYKLKIAQINRFNKFYYDKSKSIVSDREYDDLKKEIILLEKKYKFLKSKFSPKKIVGYKPSKNFQKIAHRVPMLSLSNAFGREDLVNFEKKNTKFFI